MCVVLFFFFFFKQKTAYEMRISDWSSDVCSSDLLAYNCFSYHFTPAGSMMETAAHAVGCTVFPGGTGQTEQQVRAIADLAPSGYTGTPSFLKIILEKADEQIGRAHV